MGAKADVADKVIFKFEELDKRLKKRLGLIGEFKATTFNKKNDVEKGYYQVVTQSFSIKENAIKYQNELKAKGISSFLQYKEV